MACRGGATGRSKGRVLPAISRAELAGMCTGYRAGQVPWTCKYMLRECHAAVGDLSFLERLDLKSNQPQVLPSSISTPRVAGARE